MKKMKLFAVLATVLVSQLVPVFAAVAANGSTMALPTLPVPKTLYLRVTAYSSSPDETDWDPFITADGTSTRDGIVATNLLPFGTKVMIPALFGSKVFSVEDRMAKRWSHSLDIWMPSKGKALYFGVNYANVVILENPSANPANLAVAER